MDVDPRQTLEDLRRREHARRRAGVARAARLSAPLETAAERLRSRYGALEVFVFGSLARGEVRAGSDVDLATRGLPAEHYFDALADLMRLFGGPVDLVRLEEAPPSLVERVEAEGKAL
ncbi:MAG: nucleotidyltransferase family protein [Myxococcota bacterium]